MGIEFMGFLQILEVPQAHLLTSGNRHRSVVNRHNKLRRIRVLTRNQNPTVGAFTNWLGGKRILLLSSVKATIIKSVLSLSALYRPQPQCDQYMGETLAQVTYPYRWTNLTFLSLPPFKGWNSPWASSFVPKHTAWVGIELHQRLIHGFC